MAVPIEGESIYKTIISRLYAGWSQLQKAQQVSHDQVLFTEIASHEYATAIVIA